MGPADHHSNVAGENRADALDCGEIRAPISRCDETSQNTDLHDRVERAKPTDREIEDSGEQSGPTRCTDQQ